MAHNDQEASVGIALAAMAERGICQTHSAGARKRRKSVSFSKQLAAIQQIDSLDQISDEERSMIWFTREEFADIKSSYQEIIAMARNKEFVQDSDNFCTRGLECRSKAGSRRRRETQLNALFAVLCEQERQQIEGIEQLESLAIVYRQFSYHSQQAATNMGRRDEHDIRAYTADTRAQFGLQVQIPIAAASTFSTAGRRISLASHATNRRNVAARPQSSRQHHQPSQRNSRVKVMLGSSSRRRAAAA